MNLVLVLLLVVFAGYVLHGLSKQYVGLPKNAQRAALWVLVAVGLFFLSRNLPLAAIATAGLAFISTVFGRLMQLYFIADTLRQLRARAQQAKQPKNTSSSAMALDEAYHILGLKPTASLDEVQERYRALIKRLHPDQGGTDFLADLITKARDTIMASRGK